MHFEPNLGQADEQVHFLTRGSGYTLFLTSTEAVLALHKPRKDLRNSLAPASGERPVLSGFEGARVRGPTSELIEQTVLRMQLVGANPNPQVAGLEELPGKVNYFISNDPEKWRTNIPTYAKVRYQEVYPGIDLVYYGNQQHLEFDLVVTPGADPRSIALAFDGAEKISIDPQGNLLLHTVDGETHVHKPRIYQEINGVRQFVAGGYVLNSQPSLVSFQVATYDTSKPLIIDPVLSYSTYLGGAGDDEGVGVAVDTAGNAYVTGVTGSTNFPSASALQIANRGGQDVFVTKLNSSGSALVYSTYLGGSGNDLGLDIIVDASGNAFVTGLTTSTNFPTVSSFQATHGGSEFDAFVVKVNATGSALVYSTYLGGSSNDWANGIAVHSFGNVYVTGLTASINFPTASPLQAARSGLDDAFVAKLNATGSAMVYSTYLGGSGDEEGFGIAVDISGNAYVTGWTNSTNFPTANPLQGSHGGGIDAFITKVNATGSALIYSTYLGGSGIDNLGDGGIAVDTSGNVYVTGPTDSTNFPTVSPLQAVNSGSYDIFVAKLNTNGTGLLYSTYLGGSGGEESRGVAIDSAGSAYVTGNTSSINFPTVDPWQASYGGGVSDAFITKVNATGSAVVYSTYLGGSDSGFGFEHGRDIAVDTSGNSYITGSTESANFPTANPLQGAYGGSRDAFVAKIGTSVAPPAVRLSKDRRILEAYVSGVIRAAVFKTATSLLCPPPVTPLCTTLTIVYSISAVVGVVNLAVIVNDPPDPDFSTIFFPRDYPSPIVEPGSDLSVEVAELANLTFVKLTNLYEITEAWRVTLERYTAAIAAGDLNAAEAQLAALESYILATSQAANSAKASLAQLLDTLEQIIGPVQVSQSDMEAVQADLAQNGFGSVEQAVFNNLDLSLEDVEKILNALLSVDPAQAPTDLFPGLRQLAQSYGELVQLARSLPRELITQLRTNTLAASISEPHKKTLLTFLDRALSLMADGESALAAGNVRKAKKFFHLARVQILNYFHHLHSLKSGNRALPPEVTDPLLAAAKDIIAQIDALVAGLS